VNRPSGLIHAHPGGASEAGKQPLRPQRPLREEHRLPGWFLTRTHTPASMQRWQPRNLETGGVHGPVHAGYIFTVKRHSHTGQIRRLMNKALNGQFLWVAFVLALAACLATGQSTPTGTALELSRLQGYWEGEGAGGKCTITITDNSLHYRAGTNWWKTTFTLPAGTDPQQLHATIKDSSPPTNGIGKVVFAICKIEDGTLTLAEYDGSDEPPKTFASDTSRYVLKKVQTQKKNAEPHTAN
jgi:hypothetical protein